MQNPPDIIIIIIIMGSINYNYVVNIIIQRFERHLPVYTVIITPHDFYMIVRLLFITSFSTALWCIYKSEVTHCRHIGKKLSKLVFMLYFEFLVVLCNKVKYTKTSTVCFKKCFVLNFHLLAMVVKSGFVRPVIEH